MNKKMLIDVVSEKLGTTKKNADAAVTAVFAAIATALSEGQDVKVSGFGTFKVTEVAERTGTIQMGDRKGEQYVTPAHNKVGFKPASALKDAVK